MQRRQFLASMSALYAGYHAYRPVGFAQDSAPSAATPSKSTAAPAEGWLWPTLKIGMIREGNSLEEKFLVAKKAGFAGVEMNTPGFNVQEARAASEATGLIVDGTVGGYHWKIRHTDPDPAIRADALEKLREGIRQTAEVGADTMLLVPGHGKDGSPEEVMARAVAGVRAALPQAEEFGVKILIENVWNHFLYDHGGDSAQTADALADFIDQFDSPWVGIQFDIGNHWKYGDPAGWIRRLGNRILKLDIKGFSRETGKFTAITEGDIDWKSVQLALRDINYSGWLAAEVGGGRQEQLTKVREQMETALACRERLH